MITVIKPKQIQLDSRNADIYLNSTYNSNVVFTFNREPVFPPNENYQITLSIVNFQCPYSFYTINETNNKLVINSTTYSMTYGNYTATQLKSYLTSLLSSFTITYDTTSQRLTFTNATNFTFSKNSNCQSILGFAVNTDYISVGGILTAPYPLNLGGINHLYIQSQLNVGTLSSKAKGRTNILACVPIDVGAGGVIFYRNITNYRLLLNERYISYYNIYITDEDDNYINFNNQNWSMTIEVNYVQTSEEKITLDQHMSSLPSQPQDVNDVTE